VWAPEPVWTRQSREKSVALAGNRTPALQPVTSGYSDWAVLLGKLMFIRMVTKSPTLGGTRKLVSICVRAAIGTYLQILGTYIFALYFHIVLLFTSRYGAVTFSGSATLHSCLLRNVSILNLTMVILVKRQMMKIPPTSFLVSSSMTIYLML
jgi:hypothetical protein